MITNLAHLLRCDFVSHLNEEAKEKEEEGKKEDNDDDVDVSLSLFEHLLRSSLA